ncbi:MAG: 4-vinyl reductase [Candidatus Nanohaloarchaea archaeon]|nr:4-vinyl reductase [Candidatus Nanohaloarchaea archaeon]
MDGSDEFYEGLDELADRNRRMADGEDVEERDGRGRDIDAQFLQEIMYSLETVSMGTHQLLYFSAMKYAGGYLGCDADTMSGAVAELASSFDAMNIGSLELVDDGDPAVIELSENALTDAAPESGRTMCYFVAGYIAGFLQNCLGDNFVVNEVACSAEDGSDRCRFEVRER